MRSVIIKYINLNARVFCLYSRSPLQTLVLHITMCALDVKAEINTTTLIRSLPYHSRALQTKHFPRETLDF